MLSLLKACLVNYKEEMKMVFGNLDHIEEFSFLEEGIKECFDYARTHDLASFEKGSHEIDGERLFVNIVEYTTTVSEERFWEAHKKYLDVHLMLAGMEQIDLNFIQNMEKKEFVEKDDFLVCYPSDGHRTAVAVNGPERIKKAIFKVKCNCSEPNIL